MQECAERVKVKGDGVAMNLQVNLTFGRAAASPPLGHLPEAACSKGDHDQFGERIPMQCKVGECPDCEFYPLVPAYTPGLKFCVIDGTKNGQYTKTSHELAERLQAEGNEVELLVYRNAEHCFFQSWGDIALCLDGGMDHLLPHGLIAVDESKVVRQRLGGDHEWHLRHRRAGNEVRAARLQRMASRIGVQPELEEERVAVGGEKEREVWTRHWSRKRNRTRENQHERTMTHT